MTSTHPLIYVTRTRSGATWKRHQMVCFLQDVGEQVVRAGTNAFEGKEDHGLNTLSRIAKAAAEPLVALSQTSAKVLASSTYSGTVLALTSGLGIFRLGLGVCCNTEGPPLSSAYLSRCPFMICSDPADESRTWNNPSQHAKMHNDLTDCDKKDYWIQLMVPRSVMHTKLILVRSKIWLWSTLFWPARNLGRQIPSLQDCNDKFSFQYNSSLKQVSLQ